MAIIWGEDQLEGPGGLTLKGAIAFGVPALLGLAVLLWSLSSVPFPSRNVLAGVCAAVAAGCLAVGLFSLTQTQAGDPSIGGPLLVAFALLAVLAAWLLWHSARQK